MSGARIPHRIKSINVRGLYDRIRELEDSLRAVSSIEIDKLRFLQKVLDSLTYPFYVLDANTYEVVVANSAARSIPWVEGVTCYQLTHGLFHPCEGDHPCPLAIIKENKQHIVVEHIHQDAEGNPVSVEVHADPLIDEHGNVTHIIEYCLNITERKKAHEELVRSQEMLQLVMDNIPQSIFWKDRNSVYLGCNKNFAKEAGVGDPEGIIGKTDYDLAWKKEETDAFRRDDREVMDNDRPKLHIIEPQLQANGKEAWVDTNKIPLHDVHGNVVGVLGTYEDITERKLVEIERENARKALQEVYERERRIAETLQRSFLPDTIPEIDGYDIADAYHPALSEAAIGGDVFDIFALPRGRIGLTIADVSGKGIRAARYGAMVKYMLRANSYNSDDPGQVLTLLNEAIQQDLGVEDFVTCFFAILDPSTGAFTYANAGHDEPLYIPRETGLPLRLKVTGPALGLVPSVSYQSNEARLQLGDIVFLYTDGVTDARGAEKPMGIDGLESYLVVNCALTAESLVGCVLGEVRRRSGDKLADDVAMIALEVIKQPGDGVSGP